MIVRSMLSELSKFCPRPSAGEIGIAAGLVQGVQVVRVVLELVEIGSDGAYGHSMPIPNNDHYGRTSRTSWTAACFIEHLPRRRSRPADASRTRGPRLQRACLPTPSNHKALTSLKVTLPCPTTNQFGSL